MTRTETEPGDVDDLADDGAVTSGAVPAMTPVPDRAFVAAEESVWRALDHPDSAARLAAYYDTAGGYAGRTFLEVLDSPTGMLRNEFTAADLFAVTLLQVEIAPRAARVFLDSGTEHNKLIAALIAVPDDEDIALAGPDTLAAMATLYSAVKSTLGRNPWVTASKVCARKRPRLFPVRDKRVRMLLDVYRYADNTIDWQVFSHLMQQPSVIDRLGQLAQTAHRSSETVWLDAYPLRHLDVLLWMDARDRGVGGAKR